MSELEVECYCCEEIFLVHRRIALNPITPASSFRCKSCIDTYGWEYNPIEEEY
jgi:hypothetical protein